MRTRPTGAISVPNVRIGLSFKRRSDHRLRRADAPAAAQVLERVQAEPDVQALARRGDELDDRVQARALLARACGRDQHQAAEPAGAGLAVEHLHTSRVPGLATSRAASRALSQVPDRPPARWIESTSRPALTSGSKQARKSPADGCEVVGRLAESCSSRVERVEVGVLAARGAARPPSRRTG